MHPSQKIVTLAGALFESLLSLSHRSLELLHLISTQKLGGFGKVKFKHNIIVFILVWII